MVLKVIKKLLKGGERVDYSQTRRNDPCPCGSGEKFKNCCIDKVEKKARADRDAKLFGSGKG
jgi:SEC-C motif-containing protein